MPEYQSLGLSLLWVCIFFLMAQLAKCAHECNFFCLKTHWLRGEKHTDTQKLPHVTQHVNLFHLYLKNEIKHKSSRNLVGFAWCWGLLQVENSSLCMNDSHFWMKSISSLPLKHPRFWLNVTVSHPASKLWHVPRATDFWWLCLRWLPPALQLMPACKSWPFLGMYERKGADLFAKATFFFLNANSQYIQIVHSSVTNKNSNKFSRGTNFIHVSGLPFHAVSPCWGSNAMSANETFAL